jgi:DNA repair exonuclease SbcCD ATPase subunit
VAELVERNSQLLAVARSLAEDLDASRQGLEAKIAEARAAEAADTERRIAELTETCAALAAQAQACQRTADEALRDRQVREGEAGRNASVPAAELQAARSQVETLEAEVARLHSTAAESQASLQKQLDTALGAEAVARSNAAAARAEQQLLANESAELHRQVADAQAQAAQLSQQLNEQRCMVERLEAQQEQVGTNSGRRGTRDAALCVETIFFLQYHIPG